MKNLKEVISIIGKSRKTSGKNKAVAIASSTGGPSALQEVIGHLPKDLGTPVFVVQHMPDGFTQTLAERLNELSHLKVKEAEDGETVQNGCVYIAKAGMHMEVWKYGATHRIRLHNKPHREGVRPCANYMYESLAECGYDEVVCVVLTGMGADGTDGILHLQKKKQIKVIIENEESCVVYGMPGSIEKNNIEHKAVSLENIAKEIKENVGV